MAGLARSLVPAASAILSVLLSFGCVETVEEPVNGPPGSGATNGSTGGTGGGTGGTGGGTGGTGGTGGGTGGVMDGGVDGGTGGTDGGVDPCTVELPVPEAPYLINVYAVFPNTRQGSISFDSDGFLYVGNFGPEGSNDAEARPILRVDDAATEVRPVGMQDDWVSDPDIVSVDVVPTVASQANNVFVGGINQEGDGQLTEIRSDGSIAAEVVEPCIGNVNLMLMLEDGRLLFSNFSTPNVCVAERTQNTIEVTELIASLVGDEPARGLAQDPVTEDLFITNTDMGLVRRYGVDGNLKDASYYSGGAAIGYGPAGSDFEGLLLRRNAFLILRTGLDTIDETDVTVLNGTVGTFIAFSPDDAGADLFISDPTQRVLRVSTSVRPETAAGCAE